MKKSEALSTLLELAGERVDELEKHEELKDIAREGQEAINFFETGTETRLVSADKATSARAQQENPYMNGVSLYCKSMGKVFRVCYVSKSVDEANDFMRKNDGCGVIAETSGEDGVIFVAELRQVTVNSNSLPN